MCHKGLDECESYLQRVSQGEKSETYRGDTGRKVRDTRLGERVRNDLSLSIHDSHAVYQLSVVIHDEEITAKYVILHFLTEKEVK